MTANNEYVRLKMTDNSSAITYSDVLPISGNCATGSLVLYPNPFTKQFTIGNMGAGSKTIQITSESGAIIYKQVVSAQQIDIDAQSWAAGVYMVSVQAAAGKMNTIKVVKQ
jgi:hypothetical protein